MRRRGAEWCTPSPVPLQCMGTSCVAHGGVDREVRACSCVQRHAVDVVAALPGLRNCRDGGCYARVASWCVRSWWCARRRTARVTR